MSVPEKSAAGYSAPAREAHSEFTEKRSVFIGHVRPVENESEALAFIAEMRHKYADATHNVYAYVLRENNVARYSDAGEPQGTAGIPVLEVIKKRGLTDAVIVVTRYFGGVLLGAGGLVRAYSQAASAACDEAGTAEYKPFTEFTLTASYSDYNKLLPVFAGFELKTDSTDYAENVVMKLAIDRGSFAALCREVTEATAGRAEVTETGERVDF